MHVEIGTEAAQFPEKEYINWIFVAMYLKLFNWLYLYALRRYLPGLLELHGRYNPNMLDLQVSLCL